jgi:nucleotide-binding universal stress UspA family protein
MDRNAEIVVGVDGSVESDFAVIWAVAEARARGCGLLVVHVCEPRTYGLWVSTGGLRAGIREMARPIVDDARALAARIDPGVPARGGVLVASPPVALGRLSGLAPLVVIGRHGRGAVSRLLLGSVAQHLVSSAVCPVVAVGRPAEGLGTGTVDRVIVAMTTARANEHALEFAFGEAVRRDAPMVVLDAAPDAARAASAGDCVTAALARWQGAYPGVDVQPKVWLGSVIDAVTSTCKRTDLLVLGRRRRRAFVPRPLGGRAFAILHAASCPVAVVAEPAETTESTDSGAVQVASV